MNGSDVLIYLIGLLTLVFATTAIAQTNTSSVITQNKAQNNDTQDNNFSLGGCNNLPASVLIPSRELKTSPKVSDSQASLPPVTQAKLWWAAEQFDPFEGKLVQNWLTQHHKKQINLVVNWQLWTVLDYLGRYRFVNQFGTVAREYGYSLNIFNQKEQCLAVYKYNSLGNPPKWELHLEKLGQDSLQVKPIEFERIIKKDEG